MPSMNTITNLSNSGIKTKFIRYIKYVGAFVNPKDMTRYLYKPYLVENTVMVRTGRRRMRRWEGVTDGSRNGRLTGGEGDG
jgi:hypothetical protein